MVFHRRAGKSLMLWNDTIAKAWNKKGIYWYVLRDIPQCKRVIWNTIDPRTGMTMLDYIPQEYLEGKPNNTELKITLKNGSIIQLIGASEFEGLRGANPFDIKFDEWSELDPRVWDVVRPVLAENGGTVTFSGTPKGTNHLWEALEKAKMDKDWFWDIKTVEDTKVIPNNVLESEKKEMPLAMYQQEYMCRFLDSADNCFMDIDNYIYQEKEDYGIGTFRIGFDPAGHGNDESAACVIHEPSGQVVAMISWSRESYDYSLTKLEAIWRKYDQCFVQVDGTGAGQAFCDFASKTIYNLQPYQITESSREELLRTLQVKLENNEVMIPNIDQLRSQLRAFRYTPSNNGKKYRMEVPEGQHDDLVFALALAAYGYDKTLAGKQRNRNNKPLSFPSLYGAPLARF